jgi:branched-chain amino acid transport system ATP-binding protein
MLNVKDIHTFYGLSHILFGVSLEVGQGEIVCLLGRNGAGKSTTMKSIVGLTPPRQGTIEFKDIPCTGQK